MTVTTPPRWRAPLDAVFAPRLDAVGVAPVDVDKLRGMRFMAWSSIVALFLLGWVWGVVAAVATLFGWVPHQPALTNEHASVFSQCINIFIQLLISGCAAFAMYHWKRPRNPVPLSHGLATIPVYILTMGLGFVVVAGVSGLLQLPQHDYPWPAVSDGAAFVLAAFNNVMPGPAEELALLGLVVVGLRRAGYAWWVVYVVAVAVRVPFHLYYGWGAIALAVWPLIAVYLYRRSGAIWGLVLGHALWDVTAFFTVQLGWPAVQMRTFAAGIGALIVLAVLLWKAPRSTTPMTPSSNLTA